MKASRFIALLSIMWFSLLITFVYSKVEGDIFPVTTMMEITHVIPDEDGEGSLVGGKFYKNRNCVFKGLTWYYIPNGVEDSSKVAYVGVYSRFRDKPQVRESGVQEFGKLYVRLREDDVRNHSHVEVSHDCYNGWLWNTITHFGHFISGE